MAEPESRTLSEADARMEEVEDEEEWLKEEFRKKIDALFGPLDYKFRLAKRLYELERDEDGNAEVILTDDGNGGYSKSIISLATTDGGTIMINIDKVADEYEKTRESVLENLRNEGQTGELAVKAERIILGKVMNDSAMEMVAILKSRGLTPKQIKPKVSLKNKVRLFSVGEKDDLGESIHKARSDEFKKLIKKFKLVQNGKELPNTSAIAEEVSKAVETMTEGTDADDAAPSNSQLVMASQALQAAIQQNGPIAVISTEVERKRDDLSFKMGVIRLMEDGKIAMTDKVEILQNLKKSDSATSIIEVAQRAMNKIISKTKNGRNAFKVKSKKKMIRELLDKL